DGRKVESPADWFEKRRPELLRLFSEEVYGKTPEAAVPVRIERVEAADGALDGAARREQYDVTLGQGDEAVKAALLLYLPMERKGP
ncbi:hypothetical protein, partial [Enterococcus casseliflavus]|uniref:hypothetical protein n=1 Tax=Enterococcus casseliflavus TaxID=37734 RepID=UPI003D0FAC43